MITRGKLWQVKKKIKIMNLEETAKILKIGEDMSKTTKNNGRPEGSIYEQLGYKQVNGNCTRLNYIKQEVK